MQGVSVWTRLVGLQGITRREHLTTANHEQAGVVSASLESRLSSSTRVDGFRLGERRR
jgi:hypothetical protein